MSRYNLTIADKLEIIDFHQKEKTDIRTLAARFNIGKTQAANILKNAEKIREDSKLEDPNKPKTKYFSPQGKIIDTQVYEWYLKCVENDEPISGKLIKEKALEIARNINYNGFCASNGWMQRWRVRHNVNLKPVNHNDTQQYMGVYRTNHIVNKYMPNGIQANHSGHIWPYHAPKIFNQTQYPPVSRKPAHNHNRTALETDNFDPLAFTEVSYGNEHNQDDVEDNDIILLDGENEHHFAIDSFASALDVIEDLKNFSQDDDFALEHLAKLEAHYQNEGLK